MFEFNYPFSAYVTGILNYEQLLPELKRYLIAKPAQTDECLAQLVKLYQRRSISEQEYRALRAIIATANKPASDLITMPATEHHPHPPSSAKAQKAPPRREGATMKAPTSDSEQTLFMDPSFYQPQKPAAPTNQPSIEARKEKMASPVHKTKKTKQAAPEPEPEMEETLTRRRLSSSAGTSFADKTKRWFQRVDWIYWAAMLVLSGFILYQCHKKAAIPLFSSQPTLEQSPAQPAEKQPLPTANPPPATAEPETIPPTSDLTQPVPQVPELSEELTADKNKITEDLNHRYQQLLSICETTDSSFDANADTAMAILNSMIEEAPNNPLTQKARTAVAYAYLHLAREAKQQDNWQTADMLVEKAIAIRTGRGSHPVASAKN